MKISRHDAGHITKMATKPIYGKKTLRKFGRPISMKFGRQHPELQPVIVCSNDDPGVTLTYFTAKSNFVT